MNRIQWTKFAESLGAPLPELVADAVRTESKYRSRLTYVDGYRFASRLEARRYEQLKLLQKAGEVAWFIRRPRFDLAPGVAYEADFLVVGVQGDRLTVHIEDTKGVETQTFRVKKKLMAERYPNVSLVILRKADLGRT